MGVLGYLLSAAFSTVTQLSVKTSAHFWVDFADLISKQSMSVLSWQLTQQYRRFPCARCDRVDSPPCLLRNSGWRVGSVPSPSPLLLFHPHPYSLGRLRSSRPKPIPSWNPRWRLLNKNALPRQNTPALQASESFNFDQAHAFSQTPSGPS